MQRVALYPGLKGSRRAFLREPVGHDELASGDAPWAAVVLLARLLEDQPGAEIRPDNVWSMSLADRDRLVAELYAMCFGDSVQSRSTCAECQQAFDVSFSVPALVASCEDRVREALSRLEESGAGEHFQLPGGATFRAPAVEDERFIASASPEHAVEQLFQRCIVHGDSPSARQDVQRALEEVAPLLCLELDATCPECTATHRLAFDMVRFFFEALNAERPLLFREVHCLASAYGWSHDEIMRLPRHERRAYVALVLGQQPSRRLSA